MSSEIEQQLDPTAYVHLRLGEVIEKTSGFVPLNEETVVQAGLLEFIKQSEVTKSATNTKSFAITEYVQLMAPLLFRVLAFEELLLSESDKKYEINMGALNALFDAWLYEEGPLTGKLAALFQTNFALWKFLGAGYQHCAGKIYKIKQKDLPPGLARLAFGIENSLQLTGWGQYQQPVGRPVRVYESYDVGQFMNGNSVEMRLPSDEILSRVQRIIEEKVRSWEPGSLSFPRYVDVTHLPARLSELGESNVGVHYIHPGKTNGKHNELRYGPYGAGILEYYDRIKGTVRLPFVTVKQGPRLIFLYGNIQSYLYAYTEITEKPF